MAGFGMGKGVVWYEVRRVGGSDGGDTVGMGEGVVVLAMKFWAVVHAWVCVVECQREEVRGTGFEIYFMYQEIECGGEGRSVCLFGYTPIDWCDLALMCLVDFFTMQEEERFESVGLFWFRSCTLLCSSYGLQHFYVYSSLAYSIFKI